MIETSLAPAKQKLLIVDDQPVVRERLSQLIKGESGLELCGDVDNPSCAFELIEAKQPHLVVTGLALKGAHGLDFIKDLHLRYPHVRVLVFSMYDESLYAERAIRAGGRHRPRELPAALVGSEGRSDNAGGRGCEERLSLRALRGGGIRTGHRPQAVGTAVAGNEVRYRLRGAGRRPVLLAGRRQAARASGS